MKQSRSLSIIFGEQPANNQQLVRAGQVSRLISANEHRLHSQFSMPCSLNSKRPPTDTYQIHRSLLDEHIIYCQLSITETKDFNEEVRALADVRKFASDAFILTDSSEIRIGAIVEQIVDRLVESRQLGQAVADEAKGSLFVERNSLSMVLADTMQGMYKSRQDGRLAYDQSWIVATASLANLNKRQVAIARFQQPVNFGRQSQEVRFLILVMAPNKEKQTKSAWETGRTFATMFTDIDFRRRLLRAKTQDEIKAELLVKAETLARAEQNDGNAAATGAAYLSGAATVDQPLKLVGGARQRNKLLLGELQVIPPHKSTGSTQDSTSRSVSLSGSSTSSSRQLCRTPFGGTLCSGLFDDLNRRSKFYLSDYTDGIFGHRSLYKTISTTIFLYFSVLLPCIAFGVVDTNNTDGHIDPKKTIIGQAVGGLFFAIFSGQPLVVVMTTAPLCIYVKVIYQISQDLDIDFGTFYACVGLWMCAFLILFAVTNLSNLMHFCTRSTEDIFALFTAFAFGSDGVKEAVRSFQKYYWEPDCSLPTQLAAAQQHSQHIAAARSISSHLAPGGDATPHLLNLTAHHYLAPQVTVAAAAAAHQLQQVSNHSTLISQLQDSAAELHLDSTQARCQREACILFLFLMSGTLWLANSFNAFDRTPYLSARKREIIKDYALAFAVIIFSFVGSFLFQDIHLDMFEFTHELAANGVVHFANLNNIPLKVMLTAMLLGFMLAVLFYIDQNICGAMVNNAPYKLKKGDYFHLDLLVLAILNALLSITGFPWMHGKLPHSHLHSKALADYEERVDEGHIHQTIVNIRETRLSGIFCSLLIGLSLLAIPYPLSYIPLPVLSGVFLYTALAEFKSNSMVERVCLLFTEQAAYPPNHYIRRCPQRKIHFFTFAQLLQLAIVAFVGFYPNPYVNMSFPLVVATFVPIRELLLPKLIDSKFLSSLDGKSLE